LPRALNLLRQSLHYRRESFDAGLRAAGFDLVDQLPRPRVDDLLVIWNRYGGFDEHARRFEGAGGTVLVAENGWLGKHWRGGEWFALAVGHHAGAGRWPDGGPARWDGWSVALGPWRTGGAETVILGQRSIGEVGVRSPDGWAEAARARIGRGRVRPHPGNAAPAVDLAADLASAREVVTWHSAGGAAGADMGHSGLVRLPAVDRRRRGAPAERLAERTAARATGARLAMFRRLAWAMWTLDEIRTGEPIRRLVEAAVR
jgi:hypothetical protein